MHTVILGAGISGLTAAYGLSRFSGEDYAVYEQQTRAGGYCQTVQQDGFCFDVVSHVLHFRSTEAEQLVRELVDGNLLRCKRSAWIYFRQRYIPYPFQLHLGFLPLPERLACLSGYYQAWVRRQLNGTLEARNFQQWIDRYLGEGIARHFMVPYNRKLWRCEPAQLGVDWVRPFVPSASGWDVLASALPRHVSDAGYNAYFYYPSHGGIQALIDSLETRIAPVHLNHRAVQIDLDQKTVLFENGHQVGYERLLSTVPLKKLAQLAIGLPADLRRDAEQLRSTSLLNLTFGVRSPLPHSFHWLYFPEPEYPFFRIVFPSNLCPGLAPENGSVISVEISGPDPSQSEQLEATVREQLVKLGLVRQPADFQVAARYYFEHAYPIHDHGRPERVSRLQSFFRSKGIWSFGRFGGWRYSSIDDNIVEALQAVREATEAIPARRAAYRTAAAGAGGA
ncbi:MAG: FAD-dependent oxidoreductase [Acidobacteria bacterium]|nr:FAD-dependent oxidoreductase [Acidobacteriota bacterium]